MNGRNYTYFESNLAVMVIYLFVKFELVIYLFVKFEFDWTKRFWVRVWKRKCWLTDKWTKNGDTNRRNYTTFKSNLAVMVIYFPVKFDFDWTKRFRVIVEIEMLTDRQTDKWTDGITPILKAT